MFSVTNNAINYHNSLLFHHNFDINIRQKQILESNNGTTAKIKRQKLNEIKNKRVNAFKKIYL